MYKLKRFFRDNNWRILFWTIMVLFLIVMIYMCFVIIVDFPNKSEEFVVEYYGALSQLFGGIIGGILTIVGVAITIYCTNLDRKKDLILLDKPRLMTGGNILGADFDTIKPELCTLYEVGEKFLYLGDDLIKLNEGSVVSHYDIVSLYVTNNADCILDGIMIDDKMIYNFEEPYVLLKGKTYNIDLSDYYFLGEKNIFYEITFICSSLNERPYYYSCSSQSTKMKKENYTLINLSVYFLDERPNRFNKKVRKLRDKLEDISWNDLMLKVKASLTKK